MIYAVWERDFDPSRHVLVEVGYPVGRNVGVYYFVRDVKVQA